MSNTTTDQSCPSCKLLFQFKDAAKSALAWFREGPDSENPPPGLVIGKLQAVVDAYNKEASDIEAASRRAGAGEVQLQSDVDEFWTMLDRCFEIEPREYFEKEARTNGFKSPLAMACFFMWKREPKDAVNLRITAEQQAADEATLASASAPVEGGRCAGCGHNDGVDRGGQCVHRLDVPADQVAVWDDNHCGHRCDFSRPAPDKQSEQSVRAIVDAELVEAQRLYEQLSTDDTPIHECSSMTLAEFCEPCVVADSERLKKLEQLLDLWPRLVARCAGSTSEAARPRIICLCGSTRFVDTWVNEYQRLSDEGNIVLTKKRLDNLHFRKIDLADEVFVLNVDGYIGQSTRNEIEYATKLGKPINYLESAELTKE